MIELIQQKNNLIGSDSASRALAEKDHARILVASDSHNHFDILLGILKQFGPSCDAFAFCGDGLGDIANIISLASKEENIRNVLPPVIAFVSGNCDPSSYPIGGDGRQIMAPIKQVLTVNRQNILIVHGHRESVDFSFDKLGAEMKLLNCSTSLFGHTHIAEEVYVNNLRFINPGSCSSPRGGQPESFAILTVEKNFIDTAFIKIAYEADKKLNIFRKKAKSDNKGTNGKSYQIWKPN